MKTLGARRVPCAMEAAKTGEEERRTPDYSVFMDKGRNEGASLTIRGKKTLGSNEILSEILKLYSCYLAHSTHVSLRIFNKQRKILYLPSAYHSFNLLNTMAKLL